MSAGAYDPQAVGRGRRMEHEMPEDLRFNRTLEFEYGVLETVAPSVRRVIARNPGPFTFHGTGTYVVGHGRVAVIDPGPALDEHIEALVRGLRGETITHVLVTHTHRDHSPGCALLRPLMPAPTYGYGPHGSGRVRAGDEVEGVEEGADFAFRPDVEVRDGDVIECDGFSFECVHTPGHTSNHVCYRLREERALFCGDHVMGWSTTIVSPPDGHMGTYITSLERLLDADDRAYWPTHGAPIHDPKPYVRALIGHRRLRARQVETCLRDGIDTIPGMVQRLYRDLPGRMHRAAARSVLSTIVHLIEQGEVVCVEASARAAVGTASRAVAGAGSRAATETEAASAAEHGQAAGAASGAAAGNAATTASIGARYALAGRAPRELLRSQR